MHFEDVSAISWSSIHEMLDQLCVEFQHTSQLNVIEKCCRILLEPKSWLLTLALPGWLLECINRELDPVDQLRMAKIQALIACYYKLYDDLLDEKQDQQIWNEHVIALLPLIWKARDELNYFFPKGHCFWTEMDILIEQQSSSSRWECVYRRTRGRYDLDVYFLSMLGRKAALHRWPSIAIPYITGLPLQARRLDFISETLFLVLQLTDDIVDFRHDFITGQPNAVLAASDGAGSALGISAVEQEVGKRLTWLKSEIPPGRDTRFERLISHISNSVSAISSRAMQIVELRDFSDLLLTMESAFPPETPIQPMDKD